jgi:hypothetical protein
MVAIFAVVYNGASYRADRAVPLAPWIMGRSDPELGWGRGRGRVQFRGRGRPYGGSGFRRGGGGRGGGGRRGGAFY